MTVWHRPHHLKINWILLASGLSLFAGFAHILFGIGITNYHNWYLYSGNLVFFLDPATWGWLLMIGGGLFILSSILLYHGKKAGIILGSTIVILSSIANIILLNAAPFWSALAININLLILYSLAIHGAEVKQLHH